MNVALEETEELVDGRVTARYGDCFLRGNNGESKRSSLPSWRRESLNRGGRTLTSAVLYISALEDY